MTKRLTLVGLAAVAVVWGPFVYAELARRPLSAAPSEPRAIEQAAPIEATPVVFAPAPSPEPVQPEAPAAVTVIEPAVEPPPSAAPAEPEPAAPPAAEAEEPAVVAQPAHHPAEPSAQPAEPVVQAEAPQPPAAEENAAKPEKPEAEQQPAEKAATPEAGPLSAAQAIALAPAFRSTFDNESRDAQWAEHEEPRLTQLLAASGIPASAISEVRCQSTVCRVSFSQSDLEHTSPQQLAGLVQKVREEFGPSLAVDPAKREGSDQAAAFYVLRKGFELGRARDSL